MLQAYLGLLQSCACVCVGRVGLHVTVFESLGSVTLAEGLSGRTEAEWLLAMSV